MIIHVSFCTTCGKFRMWAISRVAPEWYISFATFSAGKILEMKHRHQKVGIDLGTKTFATLSDPNTFETPSSMKRAKIKLG